jgi:predicted O-methyltransferase YrrM
MLSKILIFFLPLFAFSKNLPFIMDLNKFASIDDGFQEQETHFSKSAFNLGVYAFNYAPELTPFFASFKQSYHIDTVVETGTYLGASSAIFSLFYNEVHTIEVDPSTFELAKENLNNFKNTHCYLGNSKDLIGVILNQLQDKRVLFYLDAHWHTEFPLLKEIETIAHTHRDNCIIVIDDFKVPNRPDIEYDIYPEGQCSLEYIKNSLDLVFSEYSTHFIIPKNKKSRAKFIAIPKAWK